MQHLQCGRICSHMELPSLHEDIGAQHCATYPRPLFGAEKTLEILFPDESSRPALRTWMDWKAKGYISHLKIGRRVFYDVEDCRAALEKRFTIKAR